MPNQHTANDDNYNGQSHHTQHQQNQILQNLYVTTQSLNADNEANSDTLVDLAVALRSTESISPTDQQQPQQSQQHQQQHQHQHQSVRNVSSTCRNFTVTNPLLAEKLLSPNLTDLDNLTIGNRPHRPPDIKGM